MTKIYECIKCGKPVCVDEIVFNDNDEPFCSDCAEYGEFIYEMNKEEDDL